MSKSKTVKAASSGLLVLFSLITACGAEEKLNRLAPRATGAEIVQVSLEEASVIGGEGSLLAEICNISVLDSQLDNEETDIVFCQQMTQVFASDPIKDIIEAINL